VTNALGDLLALGTKALKFLVGCLRVLFELLQACGCLWGAPWAALVRRVSRLLKLPLHVRKPLLRLTGRLRRRPLLGGHGAADGFNQLMLHME
jgi:hypothetical protein